MRMVLVLLASLMLAGTAFAEITPPGNPDLCEQNPGNPHCHDDGGNGGGGEGGGSSVVTIDISGTIDNTNTLDNSNTTTIGDVTGGSINIYGGEEGEAAPFSNNNEIDNSSTATTGDNTNTLTGGNVYIGGGYGEEGQEGGSTLSPTSESDSSVVVGDTTLNNDSTANAYNGGNTLIIGGSGQGECYEGECEGGSGTLNSNADSNSNSESNNTNNNDSNSTSDATVNNSGNVNVDASTVNEASIIPVNSAAPSFSAICSSGGAGTGKSFSLSLAVTNDVCQALMVADAYAAMGDMEEALKWVEAAARHAKWKGGMGYFRHVITLGVM